MTARWLPAVVAAAAIVAAWGAARHAGGVTLLFVVALVASLALPAAGRRLVPVRWVAAILLLLAVSWAVALDHELAMRHTLTFLLAGALLGLARLANASDRAIGVVALAVAATALVAATQVIGAGGAPAEALAGIAPELRERALERLAVGRASGTASIPGHFAALLVMVTPLLAVGLRRGLPASRRLLSAGGLALAAAGIVASRSLIAVLVAAVLGAAAVVLRRPAWKPALAVAVLLLAVGAATAALRSDLAAFEPVRLRWVNWRTTAWVLQRHLPLGVGLGGVAQAGLRGPAGAANITPYAHNSYLQAGAELGVAGLGLVAAAAIALVRLVVAGAREHLALSLAVAALPIHNLLDFSFYSPEVVLPWAVLAGTLAARVWGQAEQATPRWLLAPVLGGGLVLAALSWRAEVLLVRSYAAPPQRTIALALDAARWAPWSATPVLAAAAAAIGASDPRLDEIDRLLQRRWWVRPVSSTWAEAHARLLVATGRHGEGLPWVREARRRAPWRGDLDALEATCRGAS